MSFSAGNKTNFKYQDVTAGSTNIIYLTNWDDITATNIVTVSPTELFGSVDQAGDLLISSAVFDAESTTSLETGTQTTKGAQKGGTDAVTGGTSATICIAATATFETDLVAVGDIAYNATTDEGLRIVSIDSETQITTEASETSPGSGWETADDVEVYAPITSTLTDSAATFISNSVYPGCLIHNDTTGEVARVLSVDSETALTTTAITGGWGYVDIYEVVDPFVFTVIAGRTYTAIANGEQPLNDVVNFPFANGYKIEVTKGGHLTVVYTIRTSVLAS